MRCKRLNNILKQRYDLDLMVEPINHEHIRAVFEHYSDQRYLYHDDALLESSEQYSKAYLISEAARLILREIAPKRTKKKGAK